MQTKKRVHPARGAAIAGPRGTVPGSASEASPAALGYLRVRALPQIADPHLARQAAAIDEFCRRKGWDLLALLRDVEVGHGSGLRQPALINAIERLRIGEASCLVVAELRQLCPSVAELGGVLEAVEHADARVVSLEPPFDTGTPIGRTLGHMLTSVSGWERARRAEMTAAARSKVGVAFAIPPDLKLRIARMRSAGMTLQAIVDQLNEEGVPTIRGGARWRPSSVQVALGYKRPRPWTQAGDDGSTAP
jgi:DNA invertase Pin-like site-specific DNA recombinase